MTTDGCAVKIVAHQKASLRRRVLLVALVLAALAFTPLLWQVYWRVPSRVDFALHRVEYEGIVRAIKVQAAASGQIKSFQQIDGCKVWAKRSESGQVTITFQTADWGHLGSAGYVYADAPLAKVTNHPYRVFDVPGNLPFVDRRLDLHWWTVYNDLD